MPNNATLAQLSNIAYQDSGSIAGWERLNIPAPPNNTGYDGTAFGRRDGSGQIVEVVVAHRGTAFA